MLTGSFYYTFVHITPFSPLLIYLLFPQKQARRVEAVARAGPGGAQRAAMRRCRAEEAAAVMEGGGEGLECMDALFA